MEESFRNLVESGFRVRPGKIEDLSLAVPMFNAAETELSGAGDWTVERYEQEWRQSGFDLKASTRLVFDPTGQVVGCVELWDYFDPPARPWIWGRVHPDWKARGIGSAMLAWALETSLRALERLPEDARLAAHTAAPSHHAPSIALFEGAGMSLSRYTWRMVKELDAPEPEPRWPEGIQIRTLRFPEDLEAVYLAQEEAFREHWGFVERPFEQGFALWRSFVFETQGQKPELWFLAVEGTEIAGFINAMERSDLDARMGWVPTLAVRKAYRRRGLGQALLQLAFRRLEELGVKQVGLSVDAKNKTGATRLYERVGMRVDQETLHYEIELRPGRELVVAG